MFFINILLILTYSHHTSGIKYRNRKLAISDKHAESIDNRNNVLQYMREICSMSIPSLEFLGMGYDAVIGDPLGNSDSHSDIGYKLPIISIPIKKWDYNKYLSTSFKIDSFFSDKCNVNGMWIRKSTSCEQRAIPSFMKTTESLHLNDTHDAGDLMNKKVIQVAIKNNTLKKTLKGNIHTNVDKLICSIYEAGIITPNEWNYTKEFNSAVKTLPENFDRHEIYNTCPVKLFIEKSEDFRCSKVVKPWINFFKKFGTHIITSILVGGQMLNMELYSDMTDKIVGKNLENGDSKSANKSNYKNLVSTKKSIFDQWSIGGVPKGKLFLGNSANMKGEYSNWAKSVYENPMPIHCGLEEIFAISDEKAFKKLLKPYRNAIKYYYELLGPPNKVGNMSMGVFNSLNKLVITVLIHKLSGMSMIIQHGKYPFSHCKDNEEVVAGFSLQIVDDKMEFEQCESGRDGCMGKGEAESSFTFILCSKEPNELITSIAYNDQEVNCPDNYIIALGYTESIRHVKGENSVSRCNRGDRNCGSKGKNTWVMCVHESVPGIMNFKSENFTELDRLIRIFK